MEKSFAGSVDGQDGIRQGREGNRRRDRKAEAARGHGRLHPLFPDHRLAPDAKWDLVRYYCDRMRQTFG